jgi:hypothetical protein
MKKVMRLFVALCCSATIFANDGVETNTNTDESFNLKNSKTNLLRVEECVDVIPLTVTCCPFVDNGQNQSFPLTLSTLTRKRNCQTGAVISVTEQVYATGCPPGYFMD